MKKLNFNDTVTNKEVIFKFSGSTEIYELENDFLCKLSKLNSAMFYPINSEKQKVTLVITILAKKTVAVLDLKGYKCKGIFLKTVTAL